jgi:hypothetical protein
MKKFAKRFLPRRIQLRLRRLCEVSKSSFLLKLSFPASPQVAQASPFPFLVARNNPLEVLGAKYAPTKRQHNYLVYYWMHFRDIRFDVRNVLEIGLQTDRSIRMWEEFFPNAVIHGVDIDPRCKQFEGERRKMHIGDQSDEVFLQHFLAEAGKPFDIIIDDGSHLVEHQLKSFKVLFPALSDHGIYVIEDTGAVVGDYGLRTARSLQGLIEHIMYWPQDFEPEDWPYLSTFPEQATWIDRNIIGIAFYRWIAFVFRGKNPEDNPFLKPKPK